MSPPLKMWVAGARPRTLPAAIVPVVVGTAAGYLSSGRIVITTPRISSACHGTVCASFDRQLSWLNAVLALVVALGIQIGTNYVNDYADGVRGTDEHRVGPVRLVAGKLASVREVKLAALIAFGVAGLAGLGLAARVTWWFIPLGIVCGLAGWAYTGGPRPYGYLGFGELFVFVFFGLVATAGSAYVQHAPFIISLGGHLFAYDYDWWFVLWAGVPVGLLAAALLQANNLRDIATDTESGKKTLAVRLGRHRGGSPVLLHPDWRGAPDRGPLPLPAVVAAGPVGFSPRHCPTPPGPERRGGTGPAPHAGHDRPIADRHRRTPDDRAAAVTPSRTARQVRPGSSSPSQ